MKKTIVTLLLASAITSQAIIVTVGDFSQGVTANDGSLLADNTGYIAVGYLNTAVAISDLTGQTYTPGEKASLISSFQIFGSSAVFGDGASNTGSFVVLPADGGRVGPSDGVQSQDAALGQNVVLMNVNGVDLAGSTELGFYVHSATFSDDSAASSPATINFSIPASGALGFDGGFQQFGLPTMSLASEAVPEPSSALLLGLGGLGLLIRRKR